MTTTTTPVTRAGPFVVGPPLWAWGTGFFAGRRADDVEDFVEGAGELSPRVILRLPTDGESPLPVVLEGARRARLRHPNVPAFVRRGHDGGRPWIAFLPVAAVRLESALTSPVPLPLALALAAEVAGAMGALEAARETPKDGPAPGEAPQLLGMRLSEVLLTIHGAALVVTPPPGTRSVRPGLLAQTPRDPLLIAPELMRGDLRAPGAADVFAVGAALSILLFPDGRTPELARELPQRVHDLLARTQAADPLDRHESLDELIRDVERCADDFPPLEDRERATFAHERAARPLDEARRALL